MFRPVSILITACAMMLPAGQVWGQSLAKEASGYNLLKSELGEHMPTGKGVSVSHIEAFEDGNQFIPPIAKKEFSGINFRIYYGNNIYDSLTGGIALNQQGTAGDNASDLLSEHAYGVGYRFSAKGSIAPDVGRGEAFYKCYNLTEWLDDDFLKTQDVQDKAVEPLIETADVQNHSYVISSRDDLYPAVDAQRRLDLAINRDGFLSFVGAGSNKVARLAEWGMMNSYNSIAVGRTDGRHSRGTTLADLPGRLNPHIVSPSPNTSFATGFLTACGALLTEHARTLGGGTAEDPRTLKAILLAGATKEEFPTWNRTASRPLDETFGAGEVNIYNSFHILDGGQQMPHSGGRTAAGLSGWDNQQLHAGSSAWYYIELTADTVASDLSLVLTWNREVTLADSNARYTSRTNIADLALKLYSAEDFEARELLDSSDSAVDNIEHIWREGFLLPGQYAIEVISKASNSGETQYGIAWRTHHE